MLQVLLLQIGPLHDLPGPCPVPDRSAAEPLPVAEHHRPGVHVAVPERRTVQRPPGAVGERQRRRGRVERHPVTEPPFVVAVDQGHSVRVQVAVVPQAPVTAGRPHPSSQTSGHRALQLQVLRRRVGNRQHHRHVLRQLRQLRIVSQLLRELLVGQHLPVPGPHTPGNELGRTHHVRVAAPRRGLVRHPLIRLTRPDLVPQHPVDPQPGDLPPSDPLTRPVASAHRPGAVPHQRRR
ncbi:hypothetical protein AB4Z54_04790 [Streptomyces sp. MCAF7]